MILFYLSIPANVHTKWFFCMVARGKDTGKGYVVRKFGMGMRTLLYLKGSAV